MPTTRYNELVGGIYDAVIDPALWAPAIDAIRREYRFEQALMGVQKLPGGEAVVNVAVNVPAPYVASIVQYGAETLDIWGGSATVANAAIEEPLLLSRFFPANWQKNRFYVEWYKPLGLVDQVSIALANDRRTMAYVGFGVHESRPPVEAETLDDLRMLAPHLRRAVQISRLLDMAVGAAATFEATLASTSSAAMLVEADMTIVYANPAAERMLESGDAVRINHGRMELSPALVLGQLELAVRTAAGPEAEMGRCGIGVPGRRRDGTPVVLHVLPLRQRARRTGASDNAVAAIFVADTGGQVPLPIDALAILYDLTPMECRVLELTASGRSSRETALALALAPSTIKTHMRNLFTKTGRHRREDLVRLARDASLPM